MIAGQLTPSELQAYRDEGVLFPLPVLTDSEAAVFLASFQQTVTAFGDTLRPRDLAQCQLHFRWTYDLVTHPRILDIVQQVLGEDILVHSLSIFWKRPSDHTYVTWHQDGHYLRMSEPALVSAWVALTPSNPGNGCLRVIPGSHLLGRLPHGDTALSEKNLLSSGLEIAVDVDESEAVDVVLRPGEMSLHDLNIVHGSNANVSPTWRIGVAIRYASPRVTQFAAHHPVLMARGVDRYRHYDVAEPPADVPIEESIARQRAFVDWLLELHRSQGRHA